MNVECRMSNADCRDRTPRAEYGGPIVGDGLRRSISRLLPSVFCILSVLGCRSDDKEALLTVQIEQLTQEKAQLQEQVDQSESKNEKLKEQVQVLSGLPEDVKLDNLYSLRKINIGRYTGFFDKDKDEDGTREKLIVYVQPVDEDGDAIKATGAVDVQLWDLDRADGEALLGEWHVKPAELKEMWFKTLLTVNYRLMFEVPQAVESQDRQLTVKVTFTDYLSGKVFKEQKIIKPRPK
ncbi:MAG: hypothetical protein ACYTGS_04330 [Planctomycetota bacterium]